MTMVTDAEVKAANDAVLTFLAQNPKTKKTIGMARHMDVMNMIHIALDAAARTRSASIKTSRIE